MLFYGIKDFSFLRARNSRRTKDVRNLSKKRSSPTNFMFVFLTTESPFKLNTLLNQMYLSLPCFSTRVQNVCSDENARKERLQFFSRQKSSIARIVVSMFTDKFVRRFSHGDLADDATTHAHAHANGNGWTPRNGRRNGWYGWYGRTTHGNGWTPDGHGWYGWYGRYGRWRWNGHGLQPDDGRRRWRWFQPLYGNRTLQHVLSNCKQCRYRFRIFTRVLSRLETKILVDETRTIELLMLRTRVSMVPMSMMPRTKSRENRLKHLEVALMSCSIIWECTESVSYLPSSPR